MFDELPPEYRSLQIAGYVLLALAIICYVGGALMTLQAIRLITITGGPVNSLASLGWVLQEVAPNFLPVIIGGVLHALWAACNAWRDVARNSFRRHGC